MHVVYNVGSNFLFLFRQKEMEITIIRPSRQTLRSTMNLKQWKIKKKKKLKEQSRNN